MARPDHTGITGGDDDLVAALEDLDADEAAELDALGHAVGAALREQQESELDAAVVDAIWDRVKPELG